MPNRCNVVKNNERARAHQEKKRRLHEAEDATQGQQPQPQQDQTLDGRLHDEQRPPASETAPSPQSVPVSEVHVEVIIDNEVGVRTSPSALSDVRVEFDNSGVISAVSSSYKVEGT
jgi:hypothetical protein